MRLIALLSISLLISGCVTSPVPDGYHGPLATIRDTGYQEDDTKALMFVVVEIDGNPIRNSLGASAAASYVHREVPARPMVLRLRGTHVTGAPIHGIFSRVAGTFYSVEGIVQFTPSPGGVYSVRGELKKEGSAVWIEETASYKRVTPKVTGQ